MTEKQLRDKVVAQAKSWLGCKESDGSHKVIVDVYNSHKPLARGYKLQYTDAWCAGFVSAVSIKCGLTDIMPTEVGVGKMIDLYKKLNSWVESDSYVPKPGDVIVYSWNDDGKGECTTGSSHVGIVTEVFGSTITIIEGNYGDAVKYRQIAVNGRYIRGFGCPKYASKADPAPAPAPAPTPAPAAPSTGTVDVHTVRYNKVSEMPVSLQKEAQELIDMGVLSGVNAKGDLDVDLDTIRCMIVCLRICKKMNK